MVLAKPQSEKKFDVASSPSSTPHPNFISPGYGAFPMNPYGQVAPGYGAAAGFQQVVIIQALVSYASVNLVFAGVMLI